MATVISQKTHKITEDQLNRHALNVAKTLSNAGFETYLVGGCIRDLLLGLTPKDFDIATAAHPEEVEPLFKRCRLIGRRFRLAHVSFGKEIIEVATFRANPSANTSIEKLSKPTHTECDPECEKVAPILANTDHHKVSEAGLVIRDNCYGSIEEDVVRRDFTINALYMDPNTLEIHDHINAMPDIKAGLIRLIGEPEVRYREDPVRTLRAIRFQAKLGFNLEETTGNQLNRYLPLLSEISPARRFEEVLKLFLTGHAQTSFNLLIRYQAIDFLLPSVKQHFDDKHWKKLFDQALVNTDDRLAIGKHVTPAFLLSVFLWPEIKRLQNAYIDEQIPPSPALHQAANEVFDRQSLYTSIPKRFAIAMREIWEYQFRLTVCTLKRCESLVQQRRFRAAYDFLLLREICGEIEPGLGDWWTKYQIANLKERKQLIELRQKKNRPRRRNRTKQNHS